MTRACIADEVCLGRQEERYEGLRDEAAEENTQENAQDQQQLIERERERENSNMHVLLGAEKRLMVDLRAGDMVLAMDETTGRVYLDRVSINLHTRAGGGGDGGDGGYHGKGWGQEGVTLVHSHGEVSVTGNHVVLLD